MAKQRIQTLLDPGTIDKINTDAVKKHIKPSAVIRQIVEKHYELYGSQLNISIPRQN